MSSPHMSVTYYYTRKQKSWPQLTRGAWAGAVWLLQAGLDDVVGGDVLVARQPAHRGRLHRDPKSKKNYEIKNIGISQV